MRRIRTVLALTATAGIALAAIGLGAASGASLTHATAASAALPKLPVDKATKLPAVKVGWADPGVGTGVVFPDEVNGAIAATDYINNSLGGINGHPIDLIKCVSDGSPEGDSACAQQVVSHNPLVFSTEQIFNMSGVYDAIEPKGIPFFGEVQNDAADFTAKNAFFLGSGAPGFLSATGTWMVQHLKPTSVAIVYDNPAASQGLALFEAPLKAAGVTIATSQYVDPATANWLTEYATLSQSNPSYIVSLFGSAESCIGLANARASEHSTIPVYGNATCTGTATIKATGDEMNGWYQTDIDQERQTANPSAQYKDYEAALDKYQGGQADSQTSSAFAVVMTMYHVFDKIGYSHLTRSAIEKYMETHVFKAWTGGIVDCAKAPATAPTTCVNSYQIYRFKGTQLVIAPGGKLFTGSPAF